MKEYVEGLEREFSAIERGFLHEQRRARSDYASFDPEQARRVAFLAYRSEAYQVRMYAVFLLGHLSQESDVLSFLRDGCIRGFQLESTRGPREAFDDFCAVRGYEAALPVIDEWLSDPRPNVRRAVTEGLRIWTRRPYFRDHPSDAIARLSRLRSDASEYVRKSVGNALRDISKKHPELVAAELRTWSLETKKVSQVYRLASTLISCATAER